jgi:hypothetical protein
MRIASQYPIAMMKLHISRAPRLQPLIPGARCRELFPRICYPRCTDPVHARRPHWTGRQWCADQVTCPDRRLTPHLPRAPLLLLVLPRLAVPASLILALSSLLQASSFPKLFHCSKPPTASPWQTQPHSPRSTRSPMSPSSRRPRPRRSRRATAELAPWLPMCTPSKTWVSVLADSSP